MKRKLINIIIVEIIIVACILLIVNSSCLSQQAPGNGWLVNLKESDRELFVIGYISGISNVWTDILTINSKKEEIDLDLFELSEKIYEFISYYDNNFGRIQQLAKVITVLYEDPINLYIGPNKMVWLAHQKIKGEDIGLLLQEARK